MQILKVRLSITIPSHLTVSADAKAAVNRFTITVKVKFTNASNPDLSYEQTFSRYADYDSAGTEPG